MSDESKLIQFLSKIKELRIAVLTGAGISAESGLRTFRDGNGLWNNYPVEDVATPEAFLRNPNLVYKFYNERRAELFVAEPNQAHLELAKLEKLLGANFSLITQNVDDLHIKAQSKRLFQMHGELRKARCLCCQAVFSWQGDIDASSKCERCNGTLRPHIVWFHEMPFYLDEIEKLLRFSNLFVAIGTSGLVYPAADFSVLAKNYGAFTVELNIECTGRNFDCCFEGPATQTVKNFVKIINNHYCLKQGT